MGFELLNLSSSSVPSGLPSLDHQARLGRLDLFSF